MQNHPFATLHGPQIMKAGIQRICDGDTIGVDWIPAAMIRTRMRLADVDASGRGRPGWTAATEALRDHCLSEELRVEWPYDTPARPCNCNRPLIYLWNGDTLVNEDIIARGLARVHRRFTDTRYYDRCAAAEAAARTARVGIWKHTLLPAESG